MEKPASELAGLTVVRDERTMSLDPIDPDTAVELYLADRESEVSQATLYSHSSRLGQFV